MADTPKMTFGIIKPDAVRAGNIGNIIQRITDSGFKIRALKLIHMTRPVAEGFYAVHRERPFFGELVEFMTSGPSVVMALEKENALPRAQIKKLLREAYDLVKAKLPKKTQAALA